MTWFGPRGSRVQQGTPLAKRPADVTGAHYSAQTEALLAVHHARLNPLHLLGDQGPRYCHPSTSP